MYKAAMFTEGDLEGIYNFGAAEARTIFIDGYRIGAGEYGGHGVDVYTLDPEGVWLDSEGQEPKEDVIKQIKGVRNNEV